MQKISLNTFQDNPRGIFNAVLDTREPVSVTVDSDREIVVLTADEYSSLMETLHLLRFPVNAERLQKGMEQHRKGQRKEVYGKIPETPVSDTARNLRCGHSLSGFVHTHETPGI